MAVKAISPAAPRSRRDISAILLSIPALLAVLVLFVFPFIFGLDLSLKSGPRGEGSWSLDNYSKFFGDSRQVDTIWTTFQVALPVTLFSVGVSVPLAYFMRRGIKFERLITTILILPITLGTVMVAQALLSYFGPKGWFNQILMGTGLIQDPVRLTRNWLGVELALFINGFPFVFLMVLGYMSGISPDLERASQMLGANRWQTFWRVIFPLSLPGVAIAFCLNFVANFGVFPSATLVGDPGGSTRVISIAAFQAAYEQNDRPMGTAIALIMGLLELLVVALVLYLRNRMAKGATLGGGKGA
ncbi:MAG TPA: ABC transporter permease [Chloroflexia bacterium]|nr:ABC transporter permease [Chloroflexia bacterium]